jgi:hypothetical protein
VAGQGGARLPPGETAPISGTTGKPMRRVRDPNAPRKQFEEVDSDIPDELLTESQKKRRRIQRMRKKQTIELALGDRKKKKENGEEGDNDDEYNFEDYYDEEDYDQEYDDEGEFVAPDLMFKKRSDADLLEDSETRAAKAAAREAALANMSQEEIELLENQEKGDGKDNGNDMSS